MEMWFSEFHTPDVKHSIRVNRQLYSKQSDYQRIDIFETPEFGRVLTLDGNVMLTERDEFIYDEMIVHVPMCLWKTMLWKQNIVDSCRCKEWIRIICHRRCRAWLSC